MKKMWTRLWVLDKANDVCLEFNKDENVHRFALSAIRGELLERER